ncbi:putative metal-dependent hydrolase [Breznakia sp. PF5-3]|uniref:M48 family metallopeptidase n=1 Tax=unclassified Breznakia TaxID=2623764 RepID=UPI002405DA18|nr:MULTISPECIES: SprT family zinc-dependent metalloprotease [unclassified Breznakia]MDF9823720.1 putative metal-dependent hydrolase [Breznakia sp. PM6-1]MDF9834518.1 putative metal-dependent hydrolase [Breznakia sp. PF5-3]MDF9837511.1 putative metal-dependent hydrolase [Breznakia sp. PFB2-8]MDF9859088.1 putative metal-dependent hydrolase [Breznakia sp. PH5-24]
MSVEKRIIIDGYVFTYNLHIKKIKNLILKVEQDGSLSVSANQYIPQHKIDAFLKERISWILKKQEQQKKQFDVLFTDCFDQDYFYLFGKKYDLICVQSNQNSVSLQENQMYVYYKHDKAECNKVIQKYIRHTCEQVFSKIVNEYVSRLIDYRLEMPTIKYRKMKSRWGSCATRSNTITLNTNLIHYPMKFGEYVVFHELVHFIQPNHSKHFYQIIANYMPDYKERIKLSTM